MRKLNSKETTLVSGSGIVKAIDWAGRVSVVTDAYDRLEKLHNDRGVKDKDSPTYAGFGESYSDLYDKNRDRDKSNKNNSRVICTHFYQKGMLSRELWRADMEYTLQYLPQSMVNGYHLWAIPYVRLMRKSPLAEKLMYPIAYHRAREIAYQMGYLEKGSIRGKIFRAILEPVCAFLGMFTTERKYQELWRNA